MTESKKGAVGLGPRASRANSLEPRAELIRPLRLMDSLVHRLTSGKTLTHSVPVSNRRFSQLPAQQDDLAVNLAGEIQQADVEVLDLDSDGINFGHRVFYALNGLLPLRFPSSQMDNIQRHAPAKKHPVGDFLELRIHRLHQFLALDGGSQERLQYRQQVLRFVESEG